MPDATTLDALQALAQRDPVLWSALNRRVKDQPLIYDNSRNLSEDSLDVYRKTVIRSDYEQELYVRLLHHRPMLKVPLRDKHKHKVCEKSRQVGVSELFLTEILHFLATHPGTKVCLTFPRDKQLTDFSVTRIAAVFAESPRMAELAGTPNQVFTKKIGDSYLILRSAWESNLGEGIDADMVVLDEKDRMRDKVELAFRECLKSSRYGLLREISTPTLPGRGIDIPFSASDQQVWMVKCEKCGDKQEVHWKDNIIQVKDFPLGCKELPAESYEFLCRKQSCRGKLDRINSGEWVARYPSRNHIRGYHISQLIAPWISATRVMQDKIDFRFPEAWFNYVCGIPATGSLEVLSDKDFELSCAGHQLLVERDMKRWSHVSVGIDWGDYSWAVVLGRSAVNQRVYLIGIGVFEDLPNEKPEVVMENYIMPFQPEITIADAGYGKDRNSHLFKKLCPNRTEGRFYAQWYNPSQKASRTFQPEFSDPARARVLVDRTMQLKNVTRAVKTREFGFPDLGDEKVRLLMKHMKSLVPFREIDDETKEIVETIKNSGEDHLAHALASAALGMEKLGQVSKFDFSFE